MGPAKGNGSDDAKQELAYTKILTRPTKQAKIVAIKEASEKVNKKTELKIGSDSKTCIDGLTVNLHKWEDRGYIGIANSKEFQATTAVLRARKALTSLQWVKGHAGIEGNEKANELANEGRLKTVSDNIELSIEKSVWVTGAKLDSITQLLATKAMWTMALDCRATRSRVGRAKWCVKEINDFSRPFRYFLWMTIYNGYKVGDYWRNIPTMEHCAECHHCRCDESMEHILLECEAHGQAKIWELTEWIAPDFGTILSCGLLKVKDPEGKYMQGDSRLYRILISESAHLIWKLRCNRVINGKADFLETEIENRWWRTIQSRLKLDCLLTSNKFGKGSLSKRLVEKTWEEVLAGKDNLPDCWIREDGVLVGIQTGKG
ncbi:hypothetical protein BT96DRAFT_1057036 [Gymnopus androsaceus JB14]|uniref:RNase H type-1 domain-containing protein n=1 Tax=Gymnopus androsaceus JB14 TaxID=1447944 RepID=A0A6A4H2K0_9AGAR|nr:hypothetical protein BT96DRAFT_1057036 [Gymnopus androsaceus JB14]